MLYLTCAKNHIARLPPEARSSWRFCPTCGEPTTVVELDDAEVTLRQNSTVERDDGGDARPKDAVDLDRTTADRNPTRASDPTIHAGGPVASEAQVWSDTPTLGAAQKTVEASSPGYSEAFSPGRPGVGDETVDLAADGRTEGGKRTGAAASFSTRRGTKIGRFGIVRVLGEGSFGTVYLAHDAQLDRSVAIKVSRLGVIVGPSEVNRFLREARAAAQLRHPHIIPVYEFGQHEGTSYIAYEFIDGETLKDLLQRRGRLSHEEAAECVAKLSAALDYAHSLGIIHRDMKPENVMIDKDGEPHIADFGLAYRDEDDTTRTRAGSLMGTPAYMSPEQASGMGHEADGRTDVWSLGVILEELLTGSRPFEGSVSQVLDRVRVADAKPLRQVDASIPKDLETIVQKCLAKKRQERYPTAGALAEDLQRWSRDEPISARRIGLVEKTWRWARRNPSVAGSLAAVLATLFVATLVSSYFAYRAQVSGELARRRQTERALAQVQSLLTAVPSSLPYLVESLQPFAQDVLPSLQETGQRSGIPESQRARIQLTLVTLFPDSRTAVRMRELQDYLLRADSAEFLVVRELLKPFADRLCADLWKVTLDGSEERERRFRAAAALAMYAADDGRWSDLAAGVVPVLLTRNSLEVSRWIDAFRPVRDRLLPQLKQSYVSTEESSSATLAATVMGELFGDRPELLVELIPRASPAQLAALLPGLKPHAPRFAPQLVEQLQGRPDINGATGELAAEARANAAIALVSWDRGQAAWPLLKSGTDNTVRSLFVERAGPAEVPPQALIDRLRAEVQPTALAAQLLCLGQFRQDQILAAQRNSLLPELLRIFSEHPHPGVHSAARWLLVRWGFRDDVSRVEAQDRGKGPTQGRGWYCNSRNQTMVVLEGPVTFDMGSPPDEPDRTPFEMLHHRRISRTFAIASTEVTVEQFREFIQEHEFSEKYAPEPSCPVVEVSWMDAAKYCRWLSEQEKVPEEQMCFPPIDKINLDMVLPADLLDKTGYRLPTAAEWECAARAGSLTSRHFGRGESLLGRFAWYDTNSQNRTWPVGGLLPNGMGLFDVYGNVGEWCQSWYFDEYVQGPAQSIIEDWPDQRIGVFRELRGGSFMDSPAVVRTADRDYDSPESRSYAIGFRLARTIRSVRELR